MAVRKQKVKEERALFTGSNLEEVRRIVPGSILLQTTITGELEGWTQGTKSFSLAPGDTLEVRTVNASTEIFVDKGSNNNNQ